MKKFLAILVAAFAVMTSFTSCDFEDEDDLYYTYSYWGATVNTDVVDVVFPEINETGHLYAGELASTTGLYFFANNTKNNFDSRLDIAELWFDTPSEYDHKATNIKEFNEIESYLLSNYQINSHQAGLIKNKCKEFKGLQIAIFKDNATYSSKSDMIILQLNEKNK